MTDKKSVIPPDLQEALHKHQVIPFVGAGVSMAVKKKLPDDSISDESLFDSWYKFLEKGIEKLKDHNSEDAIQDARAALAYKKPRFAEAAQHIHNGLKGDGWNKLLNACFDKNKGEAHPSSLELAELIWRLGSNLIITTNVDRVFQWSCKDPSELRILSVQRAEFGEMQQESSIQRPTVWHLHGHIDNKKSFVFTEQQYEDFYYRDGNRAALDFLRSTLTGKTILFIGFSLDDFHLLEQLNFIHQIYDGGASSFYALLQQEDIDNKRYPDFVITVPYEKHGEPLIKLVKEMSALANRSDKKKTLVEPKPVLPFPVPDKKPGLSNVPFNVPFNSKGGDFVGRVGKLAEIEQKLDNSNRAAIGQALSFTGMGGLGKTQLAVEYAWHYRNKYPNGVIWLTADQDMDSQLIRLSDDTVWLHPSSTSADKISVARQRLKTYDKCLIIFDNVEKFSAIEEYLPDARLRVHLLATSREELSQFPPIALDLLGRQESEKLFLLTAERRPETESEETAVADILKELDDLPLAIELVGGYLQKRDGISFSAYAKSLREHPLDTLEEKYFQDTFTKHDRNLVRTLRINDELLKSTPYLKDILDILTWSGSSSMGISLLKSLITPTNEFQFTEALQMSVSLKLLKSESDTERYSIHRLLAKVRQAEELVENKKNWVETISKRMADWFHDRREKFEYLAEYEAEIEHLQEWQKLTERFSIPEQIRLFWLEAYPYYHRGKYLESQNFVQKGFNLYQELNYSDYSLFGHLLNDLGTTYGGLGNPHKAKEYAEKALGIRKELFGENHPDTAASFNNVGSIYGNLGNHQKALEYLEKALEIRKELFGENHPDTAASFNNGGLTHRDLGNHQKALEYLEKALEICKELSGENHPSTAASFNSIGLTHRDLGNHQKALDYQEKALEIRKGLFGENHPDTATSFNNVGSTYGELGNHQEALDYQEKALEIRKGLFGENHPNTATSFNNVGSAYEDLIDYKTAIEYLEKALKIHREILGNSHPNTIIICGNLIRNYRNAGKSEQAGRLAAEFLSYIPQNNSKRKHFEQIGGIYRKAFQKKKKRR